MQENDFWNDRIKSQEVSTKARQIEMKIERFEKLNLDIQEIEIMTEILKEEKNEEELSNIKKEMKAIEEEVEKMRISAMLSGEHDFSNALVILHSGAGGTDADDWTEILFRMYTRYFEKNKFKVTMLNYNEGLEAGIKSVTMKVEGDFAYGYMKCEKGIHRLIRISPFNANGKRQTSFASVEVLPELQENQEIEINTDDLRIDTYRASGAGGQHVNKTESAIRITHIPTNIVVQCQNERSQTSNKETAMKMLKSKLISLLEENHKEKIEELAGDLKSNAFGSQIRTYTFHPYKLIKDHVTLMETSNIDSFLDGNIESFIMENLKSGADIV